MKHVQACLSDRKDRESSFHCEACASLFMCGKDLTKPFQPQWRSYKAPASLFKSQERSRGHFSPLWRSCEVRASLFMCGKVVLKPF